MIKIEVTGNSIPEVADKLLAIGASLRTSGTLVEVAKETPVDPTPAPKSVPVAEATESQPTTTEASDPDFELDVAPVVLRAVSSKGKAFVQDILSEFGSVRASQLAASLWPELIARLEAEMA
jgi:hypothetical protein